MKQSLLFLGVKSVEKSDPIFHQPSDDQMEAKPDDHKLLAKSYHEFIIVNIILVAKVKARIFDECFFTNAKQQLIIIKHLNQDMMTNNTQKVFRILSENH